MPVSDTIRVVVKGGGDLATGVAHRLHRAGMDVIITELPRPTVIRRTVAFASAVYEGEITVEGVVARLALPADVEQLLRHGAIPVLVDPQAQSVPSLCPMALVDAIMAKTNTGTRITDAPIVVALGPGFVAGQDTHAVIETRRGHDLGRVILEGSAAPDTGVPGAMRGHTIYRVLRAPCEGRFMGQCQIGDRVERGQVVAHVDGVPIAAGLSGVVRGLLADGLWVTPGLKVGDVDPRGTVAHCYTISDKARAVGGGVLEAILYLARQLEGK